MEPAHETAPGAAGIDADMSPGGNYDYDYEYLNSDYFRSMFANISDIFPESADDPGSSNKLYVPINDSLW